MRLVLLGLLIAFMVSGVIFMVACSGGQTARTAAIDKKKMYKDIGEVVVVPAYQNFATACDEMVTAFTLFKETKNQGNFDALKSAWRKAQTAWEITEFYSFGPAQNLGYIFDLDFSPCRISLIESSMAAKETFVEDDFVLMGAAAKGLPTIEYMLYKPSISNDVALFLIDERELTYFESLLKFTASTANKLAKEWPADGNDFVSIFSNPSSSNAFYTTEQLVLDDIINVLAIESELIYDSKIGKPLGKKTNGAAQPGDCESLYSKTSLANIRANILGLKALFTYTSGKILLIDHLDSISPELSKNVVLKLDEIIAKIDKQTLPLEEMVVTEVQETTQLYNLCDDLRKQIIYMVSLMSVKLHSSSSDGD